MCGWIESSHDYKCGFIHVKKKESFLKFTCAME
jgi:hypothetical protein